MNFSRTDWFQSILVLVFYFHSSLLPLFFFNKLFCLWRCVPSGPLDNKNFCGGPSSGRSSPVMADPKASVTFKGSASHSSGSSQEVCYNGGQNGQRRCRPTDTQGGSRGSHEAVLNDMSSVLKRWRLRCFPVWILKCKHVPLC